MRRASRRTLRVVGVRHGRTSDGASVEVLLSCWLERVARLIARRDTPRDPEAASRRDHALPPPA